jgi:DNA-directed RNA polymerase
VLNGKPTIEGSWQANYKGGMDLDDSYKATRDKYDRLNWPTTKRGRYRAPMERPIGRLAAEKLIPRMAEFFEHNKFQTEGADSPPEWLLPLIAKVPAEDLALATLAPLVNSLYPPGWGDLDPRKVSGALKQKMGKLLRDHLDLRWNNKECVDVGHWMLLAAAMNLSFVTLNKSGAPEIVPGHELDVDALRDELMRRGLVFMPFKKEPPDWTGYRKRYDDWFVAKFVRRGHPETEQEINEAFLKNFYHANAINRLKGVAFKVDPVMLKLVQHYAVLILNEQEEERLKKVESDLAAMRENNPDDKQLKRLSGTRAYLRKKIRNNTRTVDDDCKVARNLGGQPFWLDYNCDFRGRIYSVQHFHYGREDHVRALFKFAKGIPLTSDGFQWLEIHCANCGGFDGVDKKSFPERRDWVKKKKDNVILPIARDPFSAFDLWKGADKPFAFVAACIELAEAWKAPNAFVTHLPIPFDGSCNGIQHLALLSRDQDAAARVNLVNSEEPRDIYSDVASRVRKLILAVDGGLATWWQQCFESLDKKAIRKLCKQPVMTLSYGVTDPRMRLQLVQAYREELRRDGEPPKGGWDFLAKNVKAAAKELLPKAVSVMHHIRDIAQQCTNKDRVMVWASPSGFPCANRYLESNVKTADLKRRDKNGYFVRVARNNVPDGSTGKILEDDALNGAAANFVHSMDAAHLIFTVLSVTEPWRLLKTSGDIVTVHDCFACHASDAGNLTAAIRDTLWMMYCPKAPVPKLYGLPSVSADRDHLADLRRANGISEGELTLPAMGDFDVNQVLKAKYCWH